MLAGGVGCAAALGVALATPLGFEAPGAIPFTQDTPAATPASWTVDAKDGSRDPRASRSGGRGSSSPAPAGTASTPDTTGSAAPGSAAESGTEDDSAGVRSPSGSPSRKPTSDRTPSESSSPSPTTEPSDSPPATALPTQMPVPSPSITAEATPTPSLPPVDPTPSDSDLLGSLLGGATELTGGLSD